jgi:hypothetical protein
MKKGYSVGALCVKKNICIFKVIRVEESDKELGKWDK